jgi:hypothetical protein
MNKTLAIAGTALIAGVLAMQPAAANAACANFAIWTQDGAAGQIKKWSTEGELLATLDIANDSQDVAVSSDLSKILLFSGTDLEAYNATTGALESTNAVSGGSFYGGGAGMGVISGGKLLTDGEGPGISSVIISIDLATNVATDLVELDDADASVPVNLRGDAWSVAGDILQLPNNDILVVAYNETVYANGVILLRVNKADTTQITAVGVVATSADVWGAARGGDEIFLATDTGSLLKLASVPTAASLNPITATEIVSGGGSFWGAAGSNDSTEGNAKCELAETGVDSGSFGIAAAALIAAGGIALAARRRAVQG